MHLGPAAYLQGRIVESGKDNGVQEKQCVDLAARVAWSPQDSTQTFLRDKNAGVDPLTQQPVVKNG
jgi:hypothetical protein